MITLFTIPKAFRGEFNHIQRNAFESWLKALPGSEILVFGDDEGVGEAAREFGFRHISEVKRNTFGTPLVGDVFAKAERIASSDTLVYINADIILLSDPTAVRKHISSPRFLIVGRRWDLDVHERLSFEDSGWQDMLRERITKKGRIHGHSGIDYVMFSRGLFRGMPEFAVGRTLWDNWFLWKAHREGVPLIDATTVITIIHQNHGYSHHAKGSKGVWKGPEAAINRKLAGGYGHAFTIRDADFILSSEGLKRSPLTLYRIISFPFRNFERFPPFSYLLFSGWLAFVLWRKMRA